MIYGGLPEGRIVEFSGAEASGKTTTAFLVGASYQKAELERNPDKPRAIVFLDNEGTADPIWAKRMGYDMGADAKVSTIIRPEAQSAEQIFDMAIDMLKTGEVGLLIFDSIATPVPQQIAEESQEKKQMGGVAASLTRFANTIVGVLRKYKATLIGINQVRENMSGYGDFLQTPGGRAWKHQCSVRMMFKRGDFYDDEGKVVNKSAQSPAGHLIEIALLKTKVSKWDRKMGYMHLDYNRGIDYLEDTIDVAIHFGFVDPGAWYQVINPNTAEVLTKVQGRKKLKEYLENNKAVWKILYDAVYEKIVN